MYRIGLLLVMLLALSLGIVIGTLNPDLVSVDLLWFQLDWPLGLSLIGVLVVGMLLGVSLTWLFAVWPARSRLRKARKQLQSESFRSSSIPLGGPDA